MLTKQVFDDIPNIDYSDFCFTVSKVKEIQDKAIKQWLVWFPDSEYQTDFSKEQIVRYWLDDYRKKGILKVYDSSGKNLITKDEICFTTKGKYFVEKKDFVEFCEYIELTPSDDRSKNIGTSRPQRTTRKDNLTRAILAAMQVFGRKPSFDELWSYFQQDKDETGHIVDYTDNSVIWITTKGKNREEPAKNIKNRLSRLNYQA